MNDDDDDNDKRKHTKSRTRITQTSSAGHWHSDADYLNMTQARTLTCMVCRYYQTPFQLCAINKHWTNVMMVMIMCNDLMCT